MSTSGGGSPPGLSINGTMPAWAERAQANPLLDFVDSCLRGVGQVAHRFSFGDGPAPSPSQDIRRLREAPSSRTHPQPPTLPERRHIRAMTHDPGDLLHPPMGATPGPPLPFGLTMEKRPAGADAPSAVEDGSPAGPAAPTKREAAIGLTDRRVSTD